MRKLSQGNRTNFILFAIIVIIIIAILVASLILVSKVKKEQYEISEKALTYDVDYNPISIDQSALIDRNWDSNYYLHLKSDGTVSKLGKNALVFYTRKITLDVYGKIYEIELNGNVTESDGKNEILDLTQNRIFKIADRRYLITGNEIKNETGTLNTKNYLMIIIDKSGNTLLLNNELNTKTINPVTLQTPSFIFDVANEKLKYDDKEIDLKKIEGSTNQYKEKLEEPENVITENNNNGGSNSGANSGTIISNNNGSSTIINNNNNNNNTNININNDNNNNNNNNNSDNNDKNNTELIKSLSLRSVTATSSYIDVEYSVIDPENKYQLVYIILEQNGTQEKIVLDKTKTSYRIEKLQPNTQYTVSLAYRTVDANATSQEYIEDAIAIRTEKILANITIDKITSNKVYFTLKIDQNYIFDSAQVTIYCNGEQKDTVDVNIEQATSANGWSSSFENTDRSGELILKLEDVYYQNKKIEFETDARIKF